MTVGLLPTHPPITDDFLKSFLVNELNCCAFTLKNMTPLKQLCFLCANVRTVQQLWAFQLPGCKRPWTSPRSAQTLPSAAALWCYRSDTQQNGRKLKRTKQKKSWEFTATTPLSTDSSVLPGEGWCPGWPGWGSSPGWSEHLAEEDGIRWRIWPLLQRAPVFLYRLLPSWMWDTDTNRDETRKTDQYIFCIKKKKKYNWLNLPCKKLFSPPLPDVTLLYMLFLISS